ncbi:type II and III secretion system protein family protein [Chelatococcus sp. SYSU_G07232]|uniref:Type II and III secretion system protein family protein n=1 Tax=Chelatococcus albus TaxID=3047466 RepID=A0ABT7AEW1_9HYPH|nr:type II and III secretion system protein family protein [Chelatococcus sp. SYSU_G07232]MDJ1157645.1 type II and III secretion system protein family protein [Chelatococcus sp. SYSU_G07232]
MPLPIDDRPEMERRIPAQRRARALPFLAACLAAAAAGLAPAGAQTVAAPQLNVGAHEQAVARRIDLSIGKSLIVDLPRDAKEVFVANPKVANAVVRSTRKVFLIGMADGATSIFVMDAEGRQIAAFEITVGRDLTTLRQTLRASLPTAAIEVKPAGDSVLLVGTVDSAADAQRAVDIANAFVGQSQPGATGSAGTTSAGAASISIAPATVTGKVINSLTVRGKDQVMLKVTVAEVQRSVLKQLGINSFGTWQIGDFKTSFLLDNPFSIQNQVLSNTQIGAGLRSAAPNNFTLRALERQGVMRTLAEPNLTAISGESAKFLAGGEIPVPKSQDCDTDIIGRRTCNIGVEYKPFGVTLNFTPVVLSEGRISLRVATEVTDLDFENQIRFDQINVPGFKVRKTETTVELPSGASLVTAGLILQGSRQAINGFPGLMNIPVLGVLFRSRDYQRQESELMISVTPYIARPMNPGEVTRPDEGFVDATDPQTVLLGRLNRIYGATGAKAPPQGYRGRVGFIND